MPNVSPNRATVDLEKHLQERESEISQQFREAAEQRQANWD